jgi:hypothetical protein
MLVNIRDRFMLVPTELFIRLWQLMSMAIDLFDIDITIIDHNCKVHTRSKASKRKVISITNSTQRCL